MSGTVVNHPAYKARRIETIADLDQYSRRGALDPSYPANMRTLWSPQDDVHGALVALLNSCQRSLVIAMYGFADDELAGLVADLLISPKIHCQVTLDKSQAAGVHERDILAKWKAEYESNSVAIGTSEESAIMHRKIMIVDGRWRVSGSTNWSTSGESKQDNELTVIDSAAACAEARHILDLEHTKALTQMGRAS